MNRFTTTRPPLLILLALFAFCGLTGCKEKSAADGKKVLVLGCDGMDPRLVRRMIDEGRLPHFAKLERQGGFKPLETSIPPQSPVAWSNFITGAGPGVHGIFDFIHRDPSKQASPYFSTNKVTAEEKDPWLIPGTEYQYPRATATNELLRRGTPFWEYLDQRGIPVRMYRLPANYPPSESTHGHVCCLPGMGVPDALGSQGTFQHFSTKPRLESKGGEGMMLRIRKDFTTGAYVARLNGPPNEFERPAKGQTNPPEMFVNLNVYPDPDRDVAKIVYVNKAIKGVPDETVELVLDVGQWSEWKEVHFLKTPIGPSFGTMVRLYLQQVRPNIELYVSPLNFIPTAPAAPFSEPADFVEQIGEEVGPFYTQGFAEEFNGLKNGIFTDEEYRIQAAYVLEEGFRLLDYALKHFEDGLLFFYFSSTDLQAHMFWWDSDEPHPTRTPAEAKKYQGVIEDVYMEMDRALGKCMDALGDEATIIAMSDHGFCNFRRGFGLNTWLRDEGYLVTKSANQGCLYSDESEWMKTKAYGLGLNGLYVNLQGREKYGVVPAAERNALLEEISQKLLAIRDPENGRQVIERVYRTDQCYQGPEAVNAPDLIIGYARDYRASWNTCLGDYDKAVVMNNTNPWSADHCIAHDEVPGVVLSNRRLAAEGPALIDVAPTILNEFGVSAPDYMTGRSLFKAPAPRLAKR